MTMFITSLSSCYRDKGNYDYHEINEIAISGLKTSYSGRTGIDVLRIEPTVKMTDADAEANRFNYFWIVLKGTTVIDTIGRDAILDYPVALPPDSYTLFLRVLDKKTSVVWKANTALTVATPYSKGIMLSGVDANGNAEAEMLSMVTDTILMPGLLSQSGLPVLKGPVSMIHTGGSATYMKLWMLTKSGSYYIDRQTMKGTAANSFGKQVYLTDNLNKDNLIPIGIAPQIRDRAGNVGSTAVRAMMCSDGNIFASYLSLNGGDFYSNPINRDKENLGTLLKAAPYMLYPIGAMNSMVWYDTDNQRFMNYSSFILNTSSVTMTDNSADLFPWNQGATGRKLVYAENTRNTDDGSVNGNSFAIMKNNSNNHFIYKFYANGTTPAKRNFYTISAIATDFDKADFYAFSSRRSVVFYSVGNKLYAYDYNIGKEKLYQFPEIGSDEITMLKFDTQIDHTVNSLYIATYNAETKGTLRRFIVGSNPDVVDLTPVADANWNKLIKIKDMNWRAVN